MTDQDINWTEYLAVKPLLANAVRVTVPAIDMYGVATGKNLTLLYFKYDGDAHKAQQQHDALTEFFVHQDIRNIYTRHDMNKWLIPQAEIEKCMQEEPWTKRRVELAKKRDPTLELATTAELVAAIDMGHRVFAPAQSEVHLSDLERQCLESILKDAGTHIVIPENEIVVRWRELQEEFKGMQAYMANARENAKTRYALSDPDSQDARKVFWDPYHPANPSPLVDNHPDMWVHPAFYEQLLNEVKLQDMDGKDRGVKKSWLNFLQLIDHAHGVTVVHPNNLSAIAMGDYIANDVMRMITRIEEKGPPPPARG